VISHKTSLAVADRLFGPVTTGLRQSYLIRITKLHVWQAAICLERCWAFDLLETESRERMPLLRDLHWFRLPQRVVYKLSVLVYRCLHNLAPEYLCDELRSVADISSRQRLRSSSMSALIVPPTRPSTVGDRSFPTAACFTHLEQFATSRHFRTISTDFQEEAEAVFVKPQFPDIICRSYNRCDFVVGVAAFGLNALFVN